MSRILELVEELKKECGDFPILIEVATNVIWSFEDGCLTWNEDKSLVDLWNRDGDTYTIECSDWTNFGAVFLANEMDHNGRGTTYVFKLSERVYLDECEMMGWNEEDA